MSITSKTIVIFVVSLSIGAVIYHRLSITSIKVDAMLRNHYLMHQISKFHQHVVKEYKTPPMPDVNHDKWIVVTSIQAPTSQIRRLSTIPGWKLLVVGDLKTPKNWSYPGVVYLSPELQETLKYNVLKHLPQNNYGRKVIGYLFAIQHGANVIYETDDDTEPYANLTGFHTNQTQKPSSYVIVNNNGSNVYNPLPHFGQSSMWPRGFPLEDIGKAQSRSYSLCSSSQGLQEIPLQAGVIEGDPDVDAIFRLTRKHDNVPLDLKFDSTSPPVILPKGVFAPYNTQNTIVQMRAFWSLVLPVTVTFRETDIIRSYWAQRLLWLTGDLLAFYPPTSYQKRNQHSYIVDMKLEENIYYRMGELVHFLSNWECESTDFFECVLKLTVAMVGYDYIKENDFYVIQAWLLDLKSIGYEIPTLSPDTIAKCESNVKLILYPNEQNTSFSLLKSLAKLPEKKNKSIFVKNEKCRTNIKAMTNDKSVNLLIVNINEHNVSSNQLSQIDSQFQFYFKRIIYCVKENILQFCTNHRLTCMEQIENGDHNICIKRAMAIGFNIKHYIFLANGLNAKQILESSHKTPKSDEHCPFIFEAKTIH